MKYLAIRLAVALLMFVIGVFVTAQVNRAAYYIWPDYDGQTRPTISVDHHQVTKPCVRVFVERL